MRSSIFVAASLFVLAACQSQPPSMSLEQAKTLTANFPAAGFVPPPRTIADVTAILDQQKPDESYRAVVMARLNEPPPVGVSTERLAAFYARRSAFALQAGRGTQALADGRESVRFAKDSGYEITMESLQALRLALQFVGESPLDVTRELYARSKGDRWSMSLLIDFTNNAIRQGDVDAARRFVELSDETLARMRNDANPDGLRTSNAQTHAIYEEGIGQLDNAESWIRKALDYSRANVPPGSITQSQSFADLRMNRADWILGNHTAVLTRILIAQGRLVEAEVIARESLLYNLRRSGRTSPQTANSIGTLASVLFFQGRYKDAERLILSEIATREALDIPTRGARNRLGDAVALQRRWQEAIPHFVKSYSSLQHIASLYESGRIDDGFALANQRAEYRRRTLGENNFDSAMARGMVATGLALKRDRAAARVEFQAALAQLQANLPSVFFKSYIFENYLRFVAEPGLITAENIAETFNLADALRIATTDRAVSASVARARLPSGDLSDLARREQDARAQIAARQDNLANALSRPVEEQNGVALAALRDEINQLQQARAALGREIEKRYPEYFNLVNPPPATIEMARKVLTDGEALVALYAGEKESYVWALRKTGDVAFAVIPLRRDQLAEMVAQLRRALDANAATLGEIPAFDVALAYQLYAAILQPVEAGWKGATTLITVPHGPLAQLPFALLVTRPVAQPKDGGALFSGYQDLPFLVREVAVTQVPSVAALTILRGLPAANPDRRAFVGFGDPWFSAQQAAQARRENADVQVAAVDASSLHLRSAPATEGLASATLADLPRLPDTATEVREVAMALRADPDKDVYLGAAASERQVRTMKLDDRRVVMFATHGLVPGDLDGLSQPALALTAPAVANVEGDGLLTMEKILGLKLDADWVVLSACNTAAGSGAGADAVSGLGRAFFYAGARALLVTHWPVESTSARLLTTTTFRRQAADARLTRADALRESMLGLIDGPGRIDPTSGKIVHSYAHPIFWAPFALVGDGR